MIRLSDDFELYFPVGRKWFDRLRCHIQGIAIGADAESVYVSRNAREGHVAKIFQCGFNTSMLYPQVYSYLTEDGMACEHVGGIDIEPVRGELLVAPLYGTEQGGRLGIFCLKNRAIDHCVASEDLAHRIYGASICHLRDDRYLIVTIADADGHKVNFFEFRFDYAQNIASFRALGSLLLERGGRNNICLRRQDQHLFLFDLRARWPYGKGIVRRHEIEMLCVNDGLVSVAFRHHPQVATVPLSLCSIRFGATVRWNKAHRQWMLYRTARNILHNRLRVRTDVVRLR